MQSKGRFCSGMGRSEEFLLDWFDNLQDRYEAQTENARFGLPVPHLGLTACIIP